MNEKTKKPFRILSIDGGGIRGIFAAQILKCIEERLDIKLLEIFDMIAGTSTGSIIAAGVATGRPAADIVAIYKKYGGDIFRRKPFYWPGKRLKSILQPMCDSIYEAKKLEKVLEKALEDMQLGDVKKPLLIPSTDIGNGCVHVLKSGYSNDFTRDKTVTLIGAVLASCSAPTYFDPYKLDNYLLADGGLWANNPALAAVIDARKYLGAAEDDIQILTIGTGQPRTVYGTNTARKWGLINGWKHKEFIDFILSLQSQSALNYLNLTLRPDQIKRIDFESDLPLPLDDVSIMDDLISRADHKFTHESKAIREFLKNGGCSSD